MPRRVPIAALAALAAVLVAPVAALAGSHPDARFATFNASLNRGAPGTLVADLSNPMPTPSAFARRATSPR
jgi:hypothetical protein